MWILYSCMICMFFPRVFFHVIEMPSVWSQPLRADRVYAVGSFLLKKTNKRKKNFRLRTSARAHTHAGSLTLTLVVFFLFAPRISAPELAPSRHRALVAWKVARVLHPSLYATTLRSRTPYLCGVYTRTREVLWSHEYCRLEPRRLLWWSILVESANIEIFGTRAVEERLKNVLNTTSIRITNSSPCR